jgi:hypothetical protein
MTYDESSYRGADTRESPLQQFRSVRKMIVKQYGNELTGSGEQNAEALEFVKSYIQPLIRALNDREWAHDFTKPTTIKLFGRKIGGKRFDEESIKSSPFIRAQRDIQFPDTPAEFAQTLTTFLAEGKLPDVGVRQSPPPAAEHTRAVYEWNYGMREWSSLLERQHHLRRREFQLRAADIFRRLTPIAPDITSLQKIKHLVNVHFEERFRRDSTYEMRNELLTNVELRMYEIFNRQIENATDVSALAMLREVIRITLPKNGENRFKEHPLDILIDQVQKRIVKIFEQSIDNASSLDTLRSIINKIRTTCSDYRGVVDTVGLALIRRTEERARLLRSQMG